jgi:hypothetical protein
MIHKNFTALVIVDFVFSFQPYKSPGMDGIMHIMLQQGFGLLAGKLLMLLRASIALGYIPMSWRHTTVVFIPKPGKPVTQAKSLRPISLMSVMNEGFAILYFRFPCKFLLLSLLNFATSLALATERLPILTYYSV